MKIAIVGSRELFDIDLVKYIPEGVSEIISGGARGVDTLAAEYARDNDIPLTEILPEYSKYGKRAPLLRNELIVNHADLVLVFWDSRSTGTKYVIDYCKRTGKECRVIIC